MSEVEFCGTHSWSNGGGRGPGAEGEERESILLPRAWGRGRGNARSGGDLLCDFEKVSFPS